MPPSDIVIRLYSGAAPGSEEWTHHERAQFNDELQDLLVSNVTDPTLTLVAPDPAQANGTAVIICPGGGFHFLSMNFEGWEVARWLATIGVTSFILKYRLFETKSDDPFTELNAHIDPDLGADSLIAKLGQIVGGVLHLAHADATAAVAHVRQHAAVYGVNPNRIGILGFSAGGCVAASAAMTYTPASRPDFVAPIYLPYTLVIQNGVPQDAPPLFALAATDDDLAPHSVRIYSDWIAAGKSAELHLYASGSHGFGMRTQKLPSDRWIERFADWLGVQGMLQK